MSEALRNPDLRDYGSMQRYMLAPAAVLIPFHVFVGGPASMEAPLQRAVEIPAAEKATWAKMRRTSKDATAMATNLQSFS